MNIVRISALLLSAFATPCFAQVLPTDVSSAPDTALPVPARVGAIGLSPDQREIAIEEGATRALTRIDPARPLDRLIHGEMGAEIGNRGYRAIYGTAIIPLGDDGVAAFSFDAGQQSHMLGRARR